MLPISADFFNYRKIRFFGINENSSSSVKASKCDLFNKGLVLGVHDDQPKVVPSFLHGASKKSTSDTNLNGSRAKPPPPVPPHRKTSAPSMETDLDAPSCGQELRTNAAPVPLPGLTPATSPRTLPTVTSSEVQGSLYEAANDSTHVPDVGIYSAADDVPEVDAPPPLPVRDDDDTFYETIVPPSPMPKTEHGYKFLEAEPLYQVTYIWYALISFCVHSRTSYRGLEAKKTCM